MSQIKHRETVIQTTFALEVSDDEQMAQQPITVAVSKFSAEAFVEAYETIKQTRDQAIANMDAVEEPPAAPNGNRAQRRAKAKAN